MAKHIFMPLLLFILLSLPAVSSAGTLKVSPTSVTLEPKVKTELLYVINTDENEKINIQLEGKSWGQDEKGNDVYSDTKDVVFFPKILTIAPSEKATIRIGYRGEWPKKEKTYRVYIVELPVEKPGTRSLRMALRIGIPMFTKPATVSKESFPVIEEAGLAESVVGVKIRNKGDRHFVVDKVKAIGYDEAGKEVFSKDSPGWYVLAGSIRSLPIATLNTDECSKTSNIKVSATVEGKTVETSFKVSKDMCAQKKPEDIRTKKIFKNMTAKTFGE